MHLLHFQIFKFSNFQIDIMAKKKYWQSFTELNDTEAHKKLAADEFREELPFESGDGKSFTETPASRRDFLKYLGFSTAAAMAAGK